MGDQTPGQVSQSAAGATSARRSRSRVLVALTAVAVLAVAGGWWYGSRLVETTATPAFSTIQPIRRLTNSGTARLAAISADGRYVVHVDGSFDKQSLWMRQTSTPSSAQIVPPTAGVFRGLAFSPDGEAVLVRLQCHG